MIDQLKVGSALHILGEKGIEVYELTWIEGGFDEGKKAMLVKGIAESHGQPLKEVNRDINDNRIHFKEGVDILDLKSVGSNSTQLLDTFSNIQIAKVNNICTLFERGYYKLLKILEDDTACELYDRFVDGYSTWENNKSLTIQWIILKLTFHTLEGQQQEIQHIKTEVNDLQENTTLFAIEYDEIFNAVKRVGVTLLEGENSNAYRDKSAREKIYQYIYSKLRR